MQNSLTLRNKGVESTRHPSGLEHLAHICAERGVRTSVSDPKVLCFKDFATDVLEYQSYRDLRQRTNRKVAYKEDVVFPSAGKAGTQHMTGIDVRGALDLIQHSSKRTPVIETFKTYLSDVAEEMAQTGSASVANHAANQSSQPQEQSSDILDVAGALLQGLREERDARRRLEAKQERADTEREKLKEQMQTRQLAADIGERSWESMRKEAVQIVRRRGSGAYVDRWHAIYNRVASDTGIDLPSKYPKSQRGSTSILKSTTRNEVFFVVRAARSLFGTLSRGDGAPHA